MALSKIEEQLYLSKTKKNPKKTNAEEPPPEKLNLLIKLYNQKKFQQVLNEAQRLTQRYTKV